MKREVLNILKEANKNNIKLTVNKGALTVKSLEPIDTDLLQKIKDNKQSIIQYIEKYQGEKKGNALKINPYDRDSISKIPLSFSQERLWFLDQLQNSQAYHIPVVLKLQGKLDLGILEDSLKTIISRHEILRTVIYSEEGVGYQKVISADHWILEKNVIEEKDLEKEIASFIEFPFDLSKDYKFRSSVYNLGEGSYVFVGVFHHIASDGWSEGVFINEFIELYSAIQENRSPVLPELSLQYADYAVWQRSSVVNKAIEEELSYWEKKLKDTTPLALPADYLRPSIQSNEGSSITTTLNADLCRSLQVFCKKQGVTLFMTLLSGLKVLLSRYSGQEDICIGTPIANRIQSELEDMIGFFVNTLPLRSDLSGNPDFEEVVSRVKETTLGAYDHQLVSFERIVDRVVSTRDMSISPLFQALFVLQNTPEQKDLSLKDVAISSYEHKETTSQYDITFNVLENDSDISLQVEYCTALFDKATIKRMLIHYQELLQKLVNDSKVPVRSISPLTPEEQKTLLYGFNDTRVVYPSEHTLVTLFENQVKKQPDSKAVFFEGKSLTYKELDERSNQLAHYLLDQGVKPEKMVGICLSRSLDMIVGILGIVKAGAAYVPVDPGYPLSRIDYMLDDAAIDLVVTTSDIASVFDKNNKINKVLLDKDRDVMLNTNPIPKGPHPNQLAYVIYTSGSTGLPKGVMIEHKSIINTICSQITAFSITKKDRCLQFASSSFDASVWEIFISLLGGASLYIVPEEDKTDVASFGNFIKEHSITIATLPPAFLQILPVDYLSGIHTLITAGESISLDLAKTFSEGRTYINAYGPTESSICATTFSGTIENRVPIGVPIANTEVYILSSDNDLLPVGVVGELCISGLGLARGYLNQEGLTKEKFIAHPFKEEGRLYKTGDLARWLADGTIEFIGRKDDQVKIRGYRIELGEIENVLSGVEGVQGCCVLAQDDGNGSKRLVGYVVVEGELIKEQLQQDLHSRLPEYMVPQLWIELKEMPLTSSGKIDRKGLPVVDASQLSVKEYVAPRNNVEKQLVAIWQELLGVDKIGVYDNFFELGGHSLLATRLVAMIRKELSVEVSIRDIFVYPTILGLGLHLSGTSEGALLPAIISEDKPDHVPLSFSQERLWFIDKLEGSIAYHIPVILQLEGSLNLDILEVSLKSIISRHEVLRTVFYAEDGVGYQKVIPSDDWILNRELVKDKTIIDDKIAAFVEGSFDLSSDYMFRACVYDLGDSTYILAGVFHHIASDGWSQGILIREFLETYKALKAGGSTTLPELSLQYADYSIWQRKFIEGDVLEDQLSYWEDKLGGVTPLSLPTDYKRPSIQSYEGSNISLRLDADLSNLLSDLCFKEGATLYMVLLSAFKVLLSRYSGQKDICVGTPIANRTQSELEDMIGFFVNTLALRSDLGGNPSFKEVLDSVKETTLDAYDHQLAPFEEVVDKVIATRDMSMSPLFQVMFTLQNTPEIRDSDFDDIRISSYNLRETTSQFDLILTAIEEPGGISLSMTYCTALFTKGSMERMLVHYKELLNSLVKDIALPIHSLSMMTNQEREELLYGFNDTIVEYSEDKSIIDLFKEQVERTPDAVAIIDENVKVTYKELDERSNQLAHYLQSEGVKEKSRLGLLYERGVDMVISMIAVLKSGSAYIPLDTSLPPNRLDFILKDAEINYIVYSNSSLLKELSSDEYTFLNIQKSLEHSIDTYNSNRSIVSDTYIMYTSGTTGTPKGIVISDENVITLISDKESSIAIHPSDRVLQWSNYAFDGSTYEIFGSLLNGASLYLIPGSIVSDVDALTQVISKNQLSVVFITTALFNSFADYDLSRLSSLRILLFGGEKVSVGPTRKIASALGKERLLHVYGPTETTVYATCYPICDIPDNAVTIPIGGPLTNTSLYVLDTNMELAPMGVIGELCIGGKGLAKGYLNRQELTAEKFVAHPFISGEHLYRTGDLARWLPGGNIEFIGRKDNQVKIRGYRIELGEIESVLSSVEGIQGCCVLAQEDTNGSKRLVGYVVVEGELVKEELQQKLRSGLPEYMVPQLWVELEKIPLTSNGKIDKKKLLVPDLSLLSSKEYVAPRSETEEQLAVIWEDLLGIDKIGVYDNFFELGGHSLLVVKLISRLKDKGLQVRVRDIFANPTIGTLALSLGTVTSDYEIPANGITADCEKITPDMVPLLDFSQEELDTVVDHIEEGVANIQDMYPLSPLQEGMYFHHLMSDQSNGDPYILFNLLSFDSLDKRSRFIEALRYVITRHDVLRTCILSNGLPHAVQVVLREVTLQVSELSFSSSQNVKEELESIIDSGKHWMDLSKGPLLQLQTADDTSNGCFFLLFKQHHVIIDHVGLEKIIEEIKMYLSGNTTNYTQPVLYRDFIAHVLHQQATNDSESYFRSRLGHITDPTFPFGLSDTLGDGSSIQEASKMLSSDTSAQVRLLSRKLKISPAVIFHAAWGIVIGRCSNKEYAVFGTLFSGRLQGSLGADQSLGLFINTLPVILHLDRNVSEYLDHVKQELQGLMPYEQTPLSNIQHWSGVSNDTPLFSALLNYRHSEPQSISDNVDIDLGITLQLDKERTNYPFDLSIDDYGVDFGLTACIDGIEPDRVISYMETALIKLLEEIECPSNVEVSSLSILAEEELQLLNSFNATDIGNIQNETILDIFETQAQQIPDAVAVVYKNEKITYRELNEKSNQLAHYICNQNVSENTLIGVCVSRSIEMIVGVLGVLKSGNAYIPIDPEYPLNRISYIIEDAKLDLIISTISDIKQLDINEEVKCILLDRDHEFITKEVATIPGIKLTPEHLAYVIYTSGTTGKPKGVAITHFSLYNISLSWQKEYDLDENTRLLQMASFSFDVFTGDLCRSLLYGGQMIICPGTIRFDLQELYKLMSDHKINIIELTPSLGIPLMDHIYDNKLDIEWLKLFILGSDVCTSVDFCRLESRFGKQVRIINSYGVTEATIDSSYYEAEDLNSLSNLANVPIGKPMRNTHFYILDSFKNVLPIGVIGELYIGGSGLAQGYLHKEEQTKEKFVIHPFKPGERLYRTGDLARWLSDGNVEFIGRGDTQVKIRGYRIELGEIENVLASYETVINCCVLAKTDAYGNNRLVSYVVLKESLDKQAIEEYLKQSIPEYMIPRIWVELDKMPLTPNSKIDRKSLPDPDNLELSTQEYTAPGNELEEQLVGIWQELLGIERIGVYDNFFELGGHSLLVTRLVSVIRKELNVEVSIRDIFKYTNIHELALHLKQQSIGVLLPEIVVQQRQGRIPLSFSQERLWFLDQLEGSVAYHIPIVLRLSGSLDIDILETCFRTIISRHEILRTMIRSEEGIGYQEVVDSNTWKLDRDTIQSDVSLENSIESYLTIPFDLSKDYKFRACVYDLGSDHYVLAGVFHHIASDAWSEDILIAEFAELYSAYQENREVVLPELSLQYSDYAIWQRKYIEGEILEQQLSYWKDKLQGVAPLALPTDYARPSVQSTEGATFNFELDKTLSDSIIELCQEEGVTLFMVMLSAFKVLLYKYSGQSDICVGTPIANRTQSELENMIGFFVNTLALRSNIKATAGFNELLQEVKNTTLEGYDHQLAPFEKVVDRVIKTRDMSMNPLFQVLFTLENIRTEADLVMHGVTMSPFEYEGNTSQFDVTFNVTEEITGISFNIEYCTALFKKETVERMLIHYQELLHNIVVNPSEKIGSLSILRKEEISQLVNVFNTTNVPHDQNQTIVSLFEEQVNKTPNAIALVFEDKQLTYKELNERSNRLAYHLRNMYSLKADDIVGILLDRSDWAVISILGVLKSGAAYVPIDTSYPISRKSYIVEDSTPKVLITDSEHLFDSIEFNVSVFSIDVELEELLGDTNLLNNPSFLSSPKDLAYIIYTSGSTGKPKGVMIEHCNITNYMLYSLSAYQSETGNHNFPLFTSLSFDLTQTSIFLSLLTGGILFVYEKEAIESLPLILKNKEITSIKLTPSHLSFFEDTEHSHLKRIIIGGEALKKSHLDLLGPLDSSVQVFNEYGPTEATVGCVVMEVSQYHTLSSTSSISIGKPIDNTNVYILDEAQQLLPIGVAGELCIGGNGLARGYLNKEELSQEKFISNPFSKGERLYKTGDLAKWLPNGNLEYIGRKDDQIKIRGYRVELGEIENVLSQEMDILECCVLSKPNSEGNHRLVGYVVSENDFDKDRLQASLLQKLPAYMIPGLWVVLETIPLTSNGKIDKKALPDPELIDIAAAGYIEPRNEMEIKLAEIWKELLGVERVGVQDNFFSLGGHSLLATRLVSMIRKKLNIEIAIIDVFEYPLLSNLSEFVDSQSRGGSILPEIVPKDRNRKIPLSFSQERLWFLDQLQGSVEYHIPFTLRITGKLDTLLLENAIKEVISRHEVLHSVIYADKGIGYQKIVPVSDWSMDMVLVENEDMILKNLESFIDTPFDMAKDYMFKARLYELNKNDYVFCGVLHHIVSDGWSQGILINEFIHIYSALQAGRPFALPELPIQYADYAIWQREYIEGEILEQQLSFWQTRLQGAPPLLLPTDYDRPSIQSIEGASVNFELDSKTTQAIKKLCKEEGVTLFMFLLTVFKVLLYKYSGQDDICIGTPVANRTQAELEGLIGFFINTLVLRSDLSDNPEFRELLKQVKSTTLEGYENQLVPFEKVVDRVVKTRDMSIPPLFQVKFMLENTPESEDLHLENLEINSYEYNIEFSPLDISLNAVELADSIYFNFEYSISLFSKDTVQRMALHYKELIQNILISPSSNIGNLTILTNEESSKLLDVFSMSNTTSVSYGKDSTLVSLFEKQAFDTPEAIAVVFEDRKLTYKELNEKSNRLARHFREHYELNPGDLAGIQLNRSDLAIISMLGIMKAGAAYVPIDVEYPVSRKTFIIEDTRLKVLIVTSEKLLDSIELNVPVFSIDIELDSLPQDALYSQNPGYPVLVNDLAYLIYTSGSTGKPKGVMIEHQGIVNTICSQVKAFSITTEDRCLQFANPFFDASVWEIYISLLGGAGLYIPSEEEKADIVSFVKFVKEHQVTFATLPPAFLKLLQSDSIPSIKTLVTAGETIPLEVAKDFSKSRKYINAYGPTETSICATTFEGDITGSSVPVGKPITNTNVYILDSDMNLVSIGVPGELCVGGPGLARGYLNREELTKEKFVDNPFVDGERLYKTGDLARWLADGNIEFMGRKDDQVKIRGYRIELNEIERVLIEKEDVEHCCVVVREDSIGTQSLVGYVVVSENYDAQQIQGYLKERLPEYMIPALWVCIDELPINRNGKIDKKALPDPEISDMSKAEYVAPRNDMEVQLAAIWEELLGIKGISIHDNFFALGGHSIMAIQLISRINVMLDISLNVSVIFENPTISKFVKNMSSKDFFTHKTIIALQEKGNKKPIFFAPPVSGTVGSYLELSKALGENQPVYAFQCSGLDGKSKTSESVEKMAEMFIKAMQEVEPAGPYRLGGYSFGGAVALEMALQLKNKGFDVEELLMIDARINEVSDEIYEQIDEAQRFRELLYSEINELREIFDSELTKSKLALEGKSIPEQIHVICELAKGSEFSMTDNEIKGQLEVLYSNSTYRYVPKISQKLDTQITLFRAMYVPKILANSEMEMIDNNDIGFDYGLQKYTNKKVIVYPVPAVHTTILEETHAKEISEALKTGSVVEMIN